MSEHSGGAGAVSGRVTALIIIAFAALIALMTSRIEFAFSSDPLGPRAFPYMIAIGLFLCGLWYLLDPGDSEPWPEKSILVQTVLLIIASAVMLALLDKLGFLVVAFVLASLAAWMFGASPLAALGFGAVQALFWWALFKFALGTYLPNGAWLFPA